MAVKQKTMRAVNHPSQGPVISLSDSGGLDHAPTPSHFLPPSAHFAQERREESFQCWAHVSGVLTPRSSPLCPQCPLLPAAALSVQGRCIHVYGALSGELPPSHEGSGTKVWKNPFLPIAFPRPAVFGAFLDALEWACLSSASPYFLSPFLFRQGLAL